MAQAQLAMLRLGRLCVSIQMHTQGMSVDEATKFFQENCYSEEKPARAEAMRGTFDLGYLNYTLGKLQILKLRSDYEVQERDFFSQKIPRRILSRNAPIRLLRGLSGQAKWGESASRSLTSRPCRRPGGGVRTAVRRFNPALR